VVPVCIAIVNCVRYVAVVKVSEVFRKLRLWCLIVCSCVMFIHVEVTDMVQSFTHAVKRYHVGMK
jgi:hypothetical protein